MLKRIKSLFLFFLLLIIFPKVVVADTDVANYNSGKFNKAIRDFKRQSDFGSLEGYLNLAVAFKDLGYYKDSIKILKVASFKFPEEIRIKSLLARLFYLNSQPDKAIVVLKELIHQDPEDLEILTNLGLCYVDKGQDLIAQEYFKKVIENNKNNVLARLSLADLYYRQDKFLESLGEYKSISGLDASINKINNYWAEVLFRLKNYKESFKIYEKVSFQEPKNKFVKQRLETLREKLGKDFFEKEKKNKIQKARKNLITVTPVPSIKDMVFLRIGLVKTENPVELKSSSQILISAKNGKVISFSKNDSDSFFVLSKSKDNKLNLTNSKGENLVVAEPIIFKPLDSQGTIRIFNVKFGTNNFWASEQDRSYRGEVEIKVTAKGISIVNIVSLEEYLYSVVPSEMPSGWHKEALKAQAVAARSEAMAKIGRHKDEGFDFCAEVHCQSYSGVEVETEATSLAVDETRGQFLAYKGLPVDAIYSSNCGGHTQSNIFSDKKKISYLVSTLDSNDSLGLEFPLFPWELEGWLKTPPKGLFCDLSEYQKSSNFRWVRIYSAAEMEELVGSVVDLHGIKKIVILRRNDSGHIDAVKVIGANLSKTIEKEFNIRKIFGNLRSSMFKIEMKYALDGNPEQFIFYGGGWGHGVGMCQAGAWGMAKFGRSYRDILRHYFKDTELKKVY